MFGVGSKGGRLLRLRDMSGGGMLNFIDINRGGCVLRLGISGCVCLRVYLGACGG